MNFKRVTFTEITVTVTVPANWNKEQLDGVYELFEEADPEGISLENMVRNAIDNQLGPYMTPEQDEGIKVVVKSAPK